MDDDVRQACNEKIEELEKEVQRLRDVAVEREKILMSYSREANILRDRIKTAVEALGYETE